MRAAPIKLAEAVVAITGGGRGIGRCTAERFAEEGATVAIGDLDAELAADTAAQLGPPVHAFALDVTSRKSFGQFADAVEQQLGPIDLLVNNAGIMPLGPFLAETDRTSHAVFNVNVFGAMNGMRTVLPRMIDRQRGHVVNVASMFGKVEAPGAATYIASKHALVGLTAAVRSELRGTGVTASTVLPSVVNTELASGVQLGLAKLIRVEPEQVARVIVKTVEKRPTEVAVPDWLSLYPSARPFLPERLDTLVRRLIGDDKAITGIDPTVRSVYEQRVQDSVRGAARSS